MKIKVGLNTPFADRLDLMEKSAPVEELTRGMAWGALQAANSFVYSEMYDAVWGWGDYRDLGIEERALMLAEVLDTFKELVLTGFTGLMQTVSQLENKGLPSQAVAMRRRVAHAVVKSMPEHLQERAVARLVAEGAQTEATLLRSALKGRPLTRAKVEAVEALTRLDSIPVETLQRLAKGARR